MTTRHGVMVVTMEPPASFEEEFNDWYDTEHVPERASIDGFDSIRRYVCVAGWPRYLAVYDLRSRAVLDGASYAAISGAHLTPWSRRMLAHVRGHYRLVGERCDGGGDLAPHTAALLMLRFRGIPGDEAADLASRVRDVLGDRQDVLQIRAFHGAAHAAATDCIALVAGSASFGPMSFPRDAFGPASSRLDLVNEYAPYWPRDGAVALAAAVRP